MLHQRSCPSRHRQQWIFPGDSRGRNNSPGSPGNTFPVRSAAQLPTTTWRLLMEVSCSTWCRKTEVRRCLKTVWDNCVGSIARLVCTAARSDRSAVAGATPAGSTLLTDLTLGTPCRTNDSLGIRTQRPAARQVVSNSLRTRSQYFPENLWTTARFRRRSV